MIKAYIFDFDDTLSNRTLSTYYKYKNFIKENVSLEDPFEIEAIVQDMILREERGNASLRHRIADVVEKYHLDENLIEKFIDYWYECPNEENYLFEDTKQTLIELRNRGYKLGILSNGNSKLQHKKIDLVKMDELVDEILVSSDAGYPKPDPRVFQIIANRLNVKCEECAFVGDTFSTDILGAHRAGMLPIIFFTDQFRYCDLDVLKINSLIQLLDLDLNK